MSQSNTVKMGNLGGGGVICASKKRKNAQQFPERAPALAGESQRCRFCLTGLRRGSFNLLRTLAALLPFAIPAAHAQRILGWNGDDGDTWNYSTENWYNIYSDSVAFSNGDHAFFEQNATQTVSLGEDIEAYYVIVNKGSYTFSSNDYSLSINYLIIDDSNLSLNTDTTVNVLTQIANGTLTLNAEKTTISKMDYTSIPTARSI